MLRVVDADGQILAYVLYEDEPIRRDLIKRLTKDEARRIAVNIAIAKLPELLGGGDGVMRLYRRRKDHVDSREFYVVGTTR